MQPDWLLAAAVLLPLGAVPLATLVAGVRQVEDWLGLAALEIEVLLCLLLAGAVAGGQNFTVPLAVADLPGAHFELQLVVDGLGALFLLLTALVGLAATVLFVARVDRSPRQRYQIPLTLLTMGVLAGAFTSANLVTLYAFWQLVVLASALLLATRLHTGSLQAIGRFLVLGELGALFVLFAAALAETRGANGTLTGWYQDGDPQFRLAMLLLLTFAAVIATAAAPLHSWLGAAAGSVEPAIAPFWLGIQNKVGLYLLARICVDTLNWGQTREWTAVLVVLGGVTILVGGVNALSQRQSPRLVAFVLLAQTGYALLGLGTGEALGLVGALFHIFVQTLAAMAVLLALAAVRDSVGSDDPALVGGLIRRLPLVALVFLVGTLGLVGMPPWGGFVGLLLIYHGLAASGEAWRVALVAVGLVGSVATAVALARLGGRLFLGERLPEQGFARAPNILTQIVLWVALLACLAVGVLPGLLLNPAVVPLAGLKAVGSWADLALVPVAGGAPIGLWSPVWAGLLLALPFAAVALAARLERANPYPVLPAEQDEVLALARALSPGEALVLAPEGEPLRSARWWWAWQSWSAAGHLDAYRLTSLPTSALARLAAVAMRLTLRLLLR